MSGRSTLALWLWVGGASVAAAQSLNDSGSGVGAPAGKGLSADCSGVEIAQQDCSIGRDALARAGKLAKVGGGSAGFDFTRVCNSGEAAGNGACPAQPQPGAAPGEWGCTRDNVTGLVWELKTADGSWRDRDRTYTQFSAAYDPSKVLGSATDAGGYVKAVNDLGLCGAKDWRLPTRIELLGLVHYGAAAPAAIDVAWFPNLPSKADKAVYWAGTAHAGNPAHAWGVDFGDGVAGDDNRSIYYAVRLVRGGASAGAARVSSVSADGQEVSDPRTGLVWRRCAEGAAWNGSTCAGNADRFTWAAALARAKEASAAGWRLPNVKELASIVDDGKVAPAIDAALFPATPPVPFWSSTPAASGNAAYAWTTDFGQGHTGDHGYRLEKYAVRLVSSVASRSN